MKIACWRRLSWLTLMESLKMWWFILRVWCFRLWMLDAAAEPEQSHWVVKQKGKKTKKMTKKKRNAECFRFDNRRNCSTTWSSCSFIPVRIVDPHRKKETRVIDLKWKWPPGSMASNATHCHWIPELSKEHLRQGRTLYSGRPESLRRIGDLHVPSRWHFRWCIKSIKKKRRNKKKKADDMRGQSRVNWWWKCYKSPWQPEEDGRFRIFRVIMAVIGLIQERGVEWKLLGFH